TIRLWRKHTYWAAFQVIDVSPRYSEMGKNVVFTPDGSLFAVGLCSRYTTMPSQIRVYSAENFFVVQTIEDAGGNGSISFSLQNDLLAEAGWGKDIRLFDVASGMEVFRLSVGEENTQHYAIFSPDGTRLAVTSSESNLQLWHLP
ncbi:MAG: WD40 repeat domain-containing protein, partial [Cyanobacteriota bacterium]